MLHSRMLLLAILVLFSLSSLTTAQEVDSPFESDETTPTNSTTDVEKVVIHLPTLNLAMDWIDLNNSIGLARALQSKKRRELEELDEQSNGDEKRSEKLQGQIEEIDEWVTEKLNEVNQIPIKSTFDLDRWQGFQRELKARRLVFVENALTKQAIIEQLRKENEALRLELQRLKDSK